MIDIDDYEPNESGDNGEAQSVLDLIAPVNDKVDLSESIAELKKFISQEREHSDSWSEINLAELQVGLHDHALAISESREEYIKKRKLLATSLRTFTADVLTESCSLDLSTIQNRTKEIIEFFKADFDFLAGICKSSESAYLSLYKLLRDAPDPCIIFDSAETVIDRCIQSMSKSEKYIAKLSKSLEEKEAECAQNKLMNQDEMLLTDEAYQTKLKASLVEVKSTYEQELTNRENLLRDSLERSKFTTQQRYEELLSRKEVEVEGLRESLQRLEQQMASAVDDKALQVKYPSHGPIYH
jgi:homeobox protein cut-like